MNNDSCNADLTSGVASALRQFGFAPARVSVNPLGNAGGMSGAAIWQVCSSSSRLCLRRWPAEHPTRDRLKWIHEQIARAAKRGCDFLPLPCKSAEGQTFVEGDDGRLWELTTWMPGQADYHRHPSPGKLAAALQALARFHQATSDPAADRIDVSPGLEQRWQQVHAATSDELLRLARAIDDRHGHSIERLTAQILQLAPLQLRRAAERLSDARMRRTPLQTCLRDIWHDHLLFEGERVTGLIDFGAMRIDSPAGDVARLLGSLVGNDPDRWQAGLASYRRIWPLSPDQQQLLIAFDEANLALAGLNWTRWLFIEQRQFAARERVESRLAEIHHRLDRRTGHPASHYRRSDHNGHPDGQTAWQSGPIGPAGAPGRLPYEH